MATEAENQKKRGKGDEIKGAITEKSLPVVCCCSLTIYSVVALHPLMSALSHDTCFMTSTSENAERLDHDLTIHDRLHPSQYKISYSIKCLGSQDCLFHPLTDYCISLSVGRYLVVDKKQKG